MAADAGALGALLTVLTAACTTTASVTALRHGLAAPAGRPVPTPTRSRRPRRVRPLAGPLVVGAANVTLSGDVTMSIGLPSIETPAVERPPPAP